MVPEVGGSNPLVHPLKAIGRNPEAEKERWISQSILRILHESWPPGLRIQCSLARSGTTPGQKCFELCAAILPFVQIQDFDSSKEASVTAILADHWDHWDATIAAEADRDARARSPKHTGFGPRAAAEAD